ncbi:hypothetical protein [Mycolicibacterium peregrinum]|jgi:hypothetical protein|uniref:Uncharacterized protein n=1 Tax=Mycolicibacterium peregrinum TaxID=43304 RepID=A0A1A0W537_MYCPR|nr:hypothetical protein [Mycolicibacterium peregrinum]OBB90970.1 hypothetical protein A5779_25240 [Mycolicibacterium peregrinum]OBF46062.1 hypothetical protein A5719_00865 [Mycolicibacterium peregrinum]
MTTNKPPPISEENRKEAERVMSSYDDSRPTVTLPGSHGTVSGTAVNDWVDDDGNPIYGQPESKK